MVNSRPLVRIIATGGSIAGTGPDRLDYILYPELGKRMTIEESLARIPEVKGIADVQGEDFISVGSPAIGSREWLQMVKLVNNILRDEDGVSGVVITHGTATLEETAYFLHLTVKYPNPVVVTGAMRPPTALSADADLNLLDAIRVAGSPDAVGKGVLTVLNNQIQCARDVTKVNTFRVETFMTNDLGLLGYADSDGQVVFYRTPTRKHTTATPFDVSGMESLPRVDIVSSYAGADTLLVDAVRQNRSDGMVLTGLGGVTYPPVVLSAAAEAVKEGILVVLASRSTAGRVIMTPRKDEQGFIVCDNLLPHKARILLMLALTITQDRDDIQQMFYQY